MALNGIEPCAKSQQENVECMCGLLPEGLLELETDLGTQPKQRCRLCTGVSDHYFYGLTRFNKPWQIEVCGICGTICNEY